MKDQLFNRKVLLSLLAVVMCLGFTAMSYGQAVVSVDPATVESPAAGEELMVNINIAGGAGVGGYQVTVNFDPTALSYVAAANGDYLQGDPAAGTLFPVIKPADASVIVGATNIGVAASDGDGTLATVTFEVVEAKASTIGLTDIVISDAAGTALEATSEDGMVTVAAAEGDDTGDTEGDDTGDTEGDDTGDTEGDDTGDAEGDDATTPEGDDATTPEGETPEVETPKSQMFEITLTNLTEGVHGESGQTLSPAIFAAHPAGVKLAVVGEPASEAIVALAEGGNTALLEALAAAAGADVQIAMNADMTRRYTMPGQSSTVTLTADMVNSSLSVGSMLVSTNDAFIAVIDVPLFDEDGMPVSTTIDLMAYDAGSEDNTEMASDIPGPLGLDAEVDPPGSNARVPTEGGVIAAHEGIQGGADVSEAFAWTEPTATLMITPVEAPAEPVVEEPVVEEPVVEEPAPEPAGPGFDVTLTAGLNMISIPLMPEEPYTAKSLAEMLGATVVIQLDAATQSFVGYTVADEGDGFGIDGGMGYIVNTPTGAMVKFTGSAWDNQPEAEEPEAEEPEAEEPEVVEEPEAEEPEAEEPEVVEEPEAEEPEAEEPEVVEEPEAEEPEAEEPEVAEEPEAEEPEVVAAAPALSTFKSAWAFVVTSEIHGMEIGTGYTLVAENLRTGIIATENVTNAARRSSAVWADLNRKSVIEAGDKLEVTLYDERGNIVSGPFQRTVSTADIRNAFLNLQLNVGDVQPKDTILAQNYPNPFNPETWIPYQLSKPAEVSIHIHNVAGHLVRTLDLGLKPTGSYMTPASAAYWDGKNSVGERVASGIYFYTLQTANFAATRRMVILK